MESQLPLLVGFVSLWDTALLTASCMLGKVIVQSHLSGMIMRCRLIALPKIGEMFNVLRSLPHILLANQVYNRVVSWSWEENYRGNRNDSLTPIQNGECTTVSLANDCSPLTSPNTMHKYFPAFTWVATQGFCEILPLKYDPWKYYTFPL